MRLSIEELRDFYRIQHALLSFTNRKFKAIRKVIATPEDLLRLSPEDRYELHSAFREHPELIDDFVAENPARLDESDLEVARSWRLMVTGEFYVFRQLEEYMVFLTVDRPIIAYGVVALYEPIGKLIGADLPRRYETSLLPFRGKIVYDGMLAGEAVPVKHAVRRRLDAAFEAARAKGAILASLTGETATPSAAAESPARKARKKSAPKKAAKNPEPVTREAEVKVPATTRPAFDAIVALTDSFCRDHLDEEYVTLARKMAGVLARKRPSPIVRGKPASWASGIVRTLGFANFLGDPSQPHHMKMTDIDEGFGVSEATGSNKSREIRELLGVNRFDPEWTLPSRMDDNPLIWLLSVNGFIMDIRQAPRDAQVAAYEAGLIPYIPADREAGTEDG